MCVNKIGGELIRFLYLTAIIRVLDYGWTGYEAYSLCMLGAAVASMGRLQDAYNIGSCALAIVEKFDNRAEQAKAEVSLSACIIHWTESLLIAGEIGIKGYRSGLQYGDLVFATFGYSVAWNVLAYANDVKQTIQGCCRDASLTKSILSNPLAVRLYMSIVVAFRELLCEKDPIRVITAPHLPELEVADYDVFDQATGNGVSPLAHHLFHGAAMVTNFILRRMEKCYYHHQKFVRPKASGYPVSYYGNKTIDD